MDLNLKKGAIAGITTTIIVNILLIPIEILLFSYLPGINFHLDPISTAVVIIVKAIIVGTTYGIIYSLLYDSLKMNYYRKGFWFGLLLWCIVVLPTQINWMVNTLFPSVSIISLSYRETSLIVGLIEFLATGMLLSFIYEKIKVVVKS